MSPRLHPSMCVSRARPNVRFRPIADIEADCQPVPMTRPVYALLIDATAATDNEHAEGEKHHLLVLVSAHDAESAAAEAMIALTGKHWKGGMLKQVERFGVPLGLRDRPGAASSSREGVRGAPID